MNAERHFILGISTAGTPEVALAGDAGETVRAGTGGALESIAAFVDDALAAFSATIADVGLIGVCTGPGSFTGLRIGVAYAKTLAQTLDVPIAGISTYDVVASGSQAYPIIAVARGKKNHYYGRIVERAGTQARFIQGTRVEIERVASELATPGSKVAICGPDFSAMRPGDAARAVVGLARQARARGDDLGWTNIAIDYGQRPNAVLNWERRHVTGQEGRPVLRREPSRE